MIASSGSGCNVNLAIKVWAQKSRSKWKRGCDNKYHNPDVNLIIAPDKNEETLPSGMPKGNRQYREKDKESCLAQNSTSFFFLIFLPFVFLSSES